MPTIFCSAPRCRKLTIRKPDGTNRDGGWVSFQPEDEPVMYLCPRHIRKFPHA